MTGYSRPLRALQEGRWFKLICGASYHHLPSVRNLALAYALAGADCIDVAADPAVVEGVKASFRAMAQLRQTFPWAASLAEIPPDLPLLMVSFSDGEDPHFRKATVDATTCPSDCPRPCEAICPAVAIHFTDGAARISEDRCYGCGRCLPVCPTQQITTMTRATSLAAIAPQLLHQVDAIEIHTQVGHFEAFTSLWSRLRPYLDTLTLISISCPDHDDAIPYLWQLYHAMQPLSLPLIWQTDGRPMSGDIGRGTTHATIRFAQQVLQAGPPGFVQLAGGTNGHTVAKLTQLLPAAAPAQASAPTFGGIAYGSYARRLISPLLEQPPPDRLTPTSSPLFSTVGHAYDAVPLEKTPRLLRQAIETARRLVAPLKCHAAAGTGGPAGPAGRHDSDWATETTAAVPLPSSLFE